MATKPRILTEAQIKAQDAKLQEESKAKALAEDVNEAQPKANAGTVTSGQTSSNSKQERIFDRDKAEQALKFLQEGSSVKSMFESLHPKTPEELLEQRTKEKKKLLAMNRLATLSEGVRLISDTVGGFSGGDVYKRGAPIDTSAQEAQSQQNYLSGLQNIQNNRMAVAMKEYDQAQADRNTALQMGMGTESSQTGETNQASASKQRVGSSYGGRSGYGNSKKVTPLVYKDISKKGNGRNLKFEFSNEAQKQDVANQAMNSLSTTEDGQKAIQEYVVKHIDELIEAEGGDIFEQDKIKRMSEEEKIKAFTNKVTTLLEQGTGEKRAMAIYQDMLQSGNEQVIDFTSDYLGIPRVKKENRASYTPVSLTNPNANKVKVDMWGNQIE